MHLNLDFNLKNLLNISFVFILISIGFNVLHNFTLFISLNVPLNYLYTISWQDLVFNNFNFILTTNIILQLLFFFGLSYLTKWLNLKLPKIISWVIRTGYFFIFLVLALIFFISLQLFYLSLIYFTFFLILLIILYNYTTNSKTIFFNKVFLWIISYSLIVSFIGFHQNKKSENFLKSRIHIQTTYPIKSITKSSNNHAFNKSFALIPIRHYKKFLIGLSSQNNSIIIIPHDKIISISFPIEKVIFKKLHSPLYQDWEKIVIFLQEKFNFIN